MSCSKKDREEPSIWVKATVVSTSDINCRMPVLNFNEDSSKVRAFTGDHGFLSYVVKGLPTIFNIQGKAILVRIANLKPEEGFVCITLGPDLLAIKILDAQAR